MEKQGGNSRVHYEVRECSNCLLLYGSSFIPMILVTGATGLLGSHLLLSLLHRGHRVRAIHRANNHTERVRHIFSYYEPDADYWLSKVEWREASLTDQGLLEEALEGVSTVYHTAAKVSFHASDHKEMHRVNTGGTAMLVDLSIAAGVAQFCHVSSIATLGRASSNEACTEETYWVPSKQNSEYSISKYGAEREVWRGMEEGLRAVIINPSVILGPGFWQENSALFRLSYKGMPFYTEGMNGYVDVRDVASAMILLTEGNHFGERFICSSANLTYYELFSMMAQQFGKKPPVIRVPAQLAGFAWRAEAVRAFLKGTRPAITREIAGTAIRGYSYSSEKLIRATGFQFRKTDETIRDFCQFFLRDHHDSH